jgi:hypothetical protein
MERTPTCTMQDLPSTCKSAEVCSPDYHTISWWVLSSTRKGWWRPWLRPMRRRGREWSLDHLAVVVLAMLLPSIAWCIPHLGVSCIDHNNSRIGAIANNSNNGNSRCISRNNNNNNNNNCSSTVLLLHALTVDNSSTSSSGPTQSIVSFPFVLYCSLTRSPTPARSHPHRRWPPLHCCLPHHR